jgi:DNA mismatch repair protein MutS
LSLAWACADYLATKLHALTLFATHYFELTELASLLPGVVNVHLDAVEHDEHIVFMHQVQDGAASKSYGLQVAQLAGVPKKVIQQAKQKLAQLEQIQGQSSDESNDKLVVKAHTAKSATISHQPQQQCLSLDNVEHPLIEKLRQIAVDDLTPRQALELLYQFKRQL